MGRPLRVLIVEDNEDDMILLLRALKQQGFDVVSERVETPSTMAAILADKVWDVVISDYNMPKFNALDALRILRESGQDLPFLLVSGTITEDMAVAGMRAGAHDYLMKGNLARLGPALDRELLEAANRREREGAKRKLRDSDAKFRATFNQAAVGLAHLDFEGRWLLVNPKLCEILGYSAAELLGRRFQQDTFAEDLPKCVKLFGDVVRGESTGYTEDKRYVRRDGSLVWVNVNLSLIRDGDTPAYCLYVVEDISERKRDELEIQQLNARLRRAMEETHHRVNNNLQHIIAIIEMRDGDGRPVAELDLRALRQQVATMALVHGLLTQRAKQDAAAKWLDVREMLSQLVFMLRNLTPNRLITAHLDAAQMTTDRAAALAMIANEMVSNALRHSAGQVEISLVIQGDYGHLTVHDDGEGFAPDFNPQRAAHTGLELLDSLTRHDLGGSVHFGNRPEGGGCVKVKFPLPAVLT